MKALLIQTYVGGIYSLALIRGCEYLAAISEKNDGIVRLILVLSAIGWPFILTKLSFSTIKKYLENSGC